MSPVPAWKPQGSYPVKPGRLAVRCGKKGHGSQGCAHNHHHTPDGKEATYLIDAICRGTRKGAGTLHSFNSAPPLGTPPPQERLRGPRAEAHKYNPLALTCLDIRQISPTYPACPRHFRGTEKLKTQPVLTVVTQERKDRREKTRLSPAFCCGTGMDGDS